MMYIDKDGQFAWLAAIVIGAWLNVTINAPKIHSPGGFIKAFAVGALSGAAGYWTGFGLNSAISAALQTAKKCLKIAGGFLNGAITGAGSGAAEGFVSSAGNAWSNGVGFGQGLTAGFTGAGISLIGGAIMGGFMKGLADAAGGYRFWDGIKVNDISSPEAPSAPIVNHNHAVDDELLQERIKTIYQIQKGDWGIATITTDPQSKFNKQYSLNTNFTYNKRSGKTVSTVGGYVVQSSAGISEVHISPAYATTTDIVDFKAVAGHELIHAYHNSIYGRYCFDVQSERTAYKYTH